jgi:hypothetical protein
MTDINTHSVLFELQKNLEELSSAKEQVDFFRGKSIEITEGISEVQRNYVEHLQSIKSDYESRITQLQNYINSFLVELKDENVLIIKDFGRSNSGLMSDTIDFVKSKVSEATTEIRQIGINVDTSNNQKIEAINNLLENYKNVVEASNALIETLTAIDFPSKLDALSSKTQLIIESITNAKQALELKSNETQTSIIEKTTTAKEQIIQNTDTKFQTLTEQVNNSKEILDKTVSDKFSEQATLSKTSFENLNNSLKENFSKLNQRQDKQDKEIKTIKTILYIICGLIVIGIIATIVVLK